MKKHYFIIARLLKSVSFSIFVDLIHTQNLRLKLYTENNELYLL